MLIILVADDCRDGDSSQVWLRRVVRKIVAATSPPEVIESRVRRPPITEEMVWNDHILPAFRHGRLCPLDPETGGYIADEGRLSEGVVTMDALVSWGHAKGWDFFIGSEFDAGWWDATMNAHIWLSMPDVQQKDAAMVLCGINPRNNEDPKSTFVGGDESSPERYHALLTMFESVARALQKPRTLMVWRDIAREHDLRYHPWIDEYIQATGMHSEPATRARPVAGSAEAPSDHEGCRRGADTTNAPYRESAQNCIDLARQIWEDDEEPGSGKEMLWPGIIKLCQEDLKRKSMRPLSARVIRKHLKKAGVVPSYVSRRGRRKSTN